MAKHGLSGHFVGFVEVSADHVLVNRRYIQTNADSVAEFSARCLPRVRLERTVVVPRLEGHGLFCVIPAQVKGHRIVDLDGRRVGRKPVTLQNSTKFIAMGVDVAGDEGFGSLLA